LASLRATSEKEEANVETLRASKQEIEEQLEQLQSEIDRQRRRLGDATEAYDSATKTVEELRDGARKAQKRLDRALKEIAGWNDEIERSASDRHAIYRRCRLEEIDLPLVSGRLDRVPIEEVRSCFKQQS
jgi:structural maintenance of chromosome 1